jgi:NAD(P)-dependent dehydrogenase (short-subunit alcohol dehydrogenase family)
MIWPVTLAGIMTDQRAVIFGASGGIGRALAEQLAQSGNYREIFAGGRSLPTFASPAILPFIFDLQDEASIAKAAQEIGASGSIDLAIIATGVLQTGAPQMPEKSYSAIDAAAMAEVFAINTIGPALIAKHMLPLMRRDARATFAVLSARVGSIGDNRAGGWHSYRASKAALNMLVRNFAIEVGRRNPLGIVVGVHPGTVDTALSQPFQRSVSPEKLFTPSQSASHIIDVLNGLTQQDTGGLFAWDGAAIPF